MGILLYFLSAVTGGQTGYIISVLVNNNNSYLTALLATAFAVLFILVCLFIQKNTYNYTKKLKKKDRNAKHFLSYSDKIISKTIDPVLKIRLSLLVCDYYKDNGNYPEAIKSLDISYDRNSSLKAVRRMIIPEKYKFQYFLKVIEVNTTANNLIDAQTAFEKGKKYLEKFCVSKKYRFTILKVLSAFEYSKGNFSTAETLINEAIFLTYSDEIKDELSVLLAKIYYNTERYQLFESLLEKIIQNNSSSKNVKNATNLLLKKI